MAGNMPCRAGLLCKTRELRVHTVICALQGLNLAAIGAETDRRGYVPVSEKMEVLDKAGKPVPNVYCIGDANGDALARLLRQP